MKQKYLCYLRDVKPCKNSLSPQNWVWFCFHLLTEIAEIELVLFIYVYTFYTLKNYWPNPGLCMHNPYQLLRSMANKRTGTKVTPLPNSQHFQTGLHRYSIEDRSSYTYMSTSIPSQVRNYILAISHPNGNASVETHMSPR